MPPPKDPEKYKEYCERMQKRILCYCAYCGREMSVIPSRLAKSVSGRVCCSKLCSDSLKRGIESKRKKKGKIKISKICERCGVVFLVDDVYRSKDKKFCSRRCANTRVVTEDTRQKIRQTKTKELIERICPTCGEVFHVKPYSKKIFCNKNCSISTVINSNKRRVGEKSPRWRGGVTTLNTLIRLHPKCKDWTRQILMRDHFCDWFSGLHTSNAVAHHIIHFSVLIRKYHIKTLTDALACEPLWDLNNGITMSAENHNAYHEMWGKYN